MDRNERCETWRRHLRLTGAYRAGDLAAVKAALGWPEDFPNTVQPMELACGDRPLITALQLSPVPFIRRLLELGADPNFAAPDGFPPLLSIMDVDRPDRIEALQLLLDHGADVGQRGINDWSALHYAVARRNLEAIERLLAHGADPNARTRMDDCSSPLEEARAIGWQAAVQAMGG